MGSEAPGPLPNLTASPPSLAAETEAAAITKPILDAIDGCKTALMLYKDYLASECTLICLDVDKIWSRLTTAEERIFDVEDITTSHIAQL